MQNVQVMREISKGVNLMRLFVEERGAVKLVKEMYRFTSKEAPELLYLGLLATKNNKN